MSLIGRLLPPRGRIANVRCGTHTCRITGRPREEVPSPDRSAQLPTPRLTLRRVAEIPYPRTVHPLRRPRLHRFRSGQAVHAIAAQSTAVPTSPASPATTRGRAASAAHCTERGLCRARVERQARCLAANGRAPGYEAKRFGAGSEQVLVVNNPNTLGLTGRPLACSAKSPRRLAQPNRPESAAAQDRNCP